MIRLLDAMAIIISAVYVVLFAASLVLGQFLPTLEDIASQRDQSCYWTDAMLAFVDCGEEVFSGTIRAHFYNLWMQPLFSLMPISMKALFIYAPLFFMIFRSMVAFRQHSFRKNKGHQRG